MRAILCGFEENMKERFYLFIDWLLISYWVGFWPIFYVTDYLREHGTSTGLVSVLTKCLYLIPLASGAAVVNYSFRCLRSAGTILRGTILAALVTGIACAYILIVRGYPRVGVIAAVYYVPQLPVPFFGKVPDKTPWGQKIRCAISGSYGYPRYSAGCCCRFAWWREIRRRLRSSSAP